jgi:hypothetical protein
VEIGGFRVKFGVFEGNWVRKCGFFIGNSGFLRDFDIKRVEYGWIWYKNGMGEFDIKMVDYGWIWLKRGGLGVFMGGKRGFRVKFGVFEGNWVRKCGFLVDFKWFYI